MSNSSSAQRLVAEYRALSAASGAAVDNSENVRKVNLLEVLDEDANDPAVSQLLLDVLADKNEYDLARIEAAKIVGLYVTEESPLEHELKGQVWKIFLDKADDYLVRQHASQNYEVGFGGPNERQKIAELLFDNADDEDVRHRALAYLKHIKHTPFGHELIARLPDDPYWSKYAQTIERLRSDSKE